LKTADHVDLSQAIVADSSQQLGDSHLFLNLITPLAMMPIMLYRFFRSVIFEGKGLTIL